MKIKNLFFLCIATTLFFNNKIDAISNGQQFVGFCAFVLVGGVITRWACAGSGAEIAKASMPGLASGLVQVGAPPAAKAIVDIIKIPFVNPIDQRIKDGIQERQILSEKYNSLQQLYNPNKKNEELDKLIQSTSQQQLALEKKITKLSEKKAFDQNRMNVIY